MTQDMPFAGIPGQKHAALINSFSTILPRGKSLHSRLDTLGIDLDGIKSLVSENDLMVDEDAEEAEFQRMTLQRKAGGKLYSDEESDNGDELELEDDNQISNQQVLIRQEHAEFVSFSPERHQQVDTTRPTMPTFIIDGRRHVLATTSTGESLLRFTQLFEHISDRHMVKLSEQAAHLRQSQQRFALLPSDDESAAFLSQRVQINQQQSNYLLSPVDFLSTESRQIEYIQPSNLALESDEPTRVEVEERLEDQQSQSHSYALVDHMDWENGIIWESKTDDEMVSSPSIGIASRESLDNSKTLLVSFQQDVMKLLRQHESTSPEVVHWADSSDEMTELRKQQQILQNMESSLDRANLTEYAAIQQRIDGLSSRASPQVVHQVPIRSLAAPEPQPHQAESSAQQPSSVSTSTNSTPTAITSPSNAPAQEPRKSYYARKKERERLRLMHQTLLERDLLAKRQVMGQNPLVASRYNAVDDRRDANTWEQDLENDTHNPWLDSDAWLDQVVWTHGQTPALMPYTRLILDMNDHFMVFKETRSLDQEDQQTEQSSVKREQHPNRFNLSLDHAYDSVASSVLGTHSAQYHRAQHTIAHSLPAQLVDPLWFRTTLSRSAIRLLHRERYKFSVGQDLTISLHLFEENRAKRGNGVRIKEIKRSQLSCLKHRVVLLEHAERDPPVLNNVGMGSKIINYFKKTDHDQRAIPARDDGQTVVIRSQQEIPLLGPLQDGEHLTAIENSLYAAQMFKHDMPSTDFLLVMQTSSEDPSEQPAMYLREIPTVYAVGHTQARVEIPQTQSRASINFLRNRINHYIFRHFLDQQNRGERMRLRAEEIKQAFVHLPDTTTRKQLKELCTFSRGGEDAGYWVPKPDVQIPSEEELKLLVTPEMICLNESLMKGELLLEDAGVSPAVSMAAYILAFGDLNAHDPRIKDTIRFIERYYNLTSWAKSINFLKAVSVAEGADLALLEVAAQNFSREEIDRLARSMENAIRMVFKDSPSAISSDESMGLTVEQAKQILLEHGFEASKIKRLSQADRKLTALKVLNGEINPQAWDDNTKQKSAKDLVRMDKFKEALQVIFSRESVKLLNGIPYYTSAVSTGTTVGSISSLQSSKSRSLEVEDTDDDDEEMLDRALEDMLQMQDDEDDASQLSPTLAVATEDEEVEELQRLLEDDTSDSEEFSISDSTSVDDSNGADDGGRASSFSLQQLRSSGSQLTVAAVAAAQPSFVREPGQEAKSKRYVVKKTMTKKLPDGTVETKIEWIHDPQQVEYYRNKKMNSNLSGAGVVQAKNSRRTKLAFASEMDDRFQAGMQERRKLQDQFRRWKKMVEEEGRDKLDALAATGTSSQKKALAAARKEKMAAKRGESSAKTKTRRLKRKSGADTFHSTNRRQPAADDEAPGPSRARKQPRQKTAMAPRNAKRPRPSYVLGESSEASAADESEYVPTPTSMGEVSSPVDASWEGPAAKRIRSGEYTFSSGSAAQEKCLLAL